MIGRKTKPKFSLPKSAAGRTTTRSDIDHGWVEETSSGMNRTKATSHHHNLSLSLPRPDYYAKPTHSQRSGAKATKQPLSPDVNDNCKVRHSDDAKPTHSQKTGATETKREYSPWVKDHHIVEAREGFMHEVLVGVDGTEIDIYAYPMPCRPYYFSDDPEKDVKPPRPEGVSLFASYFPGYELNINCRYSDTDEDEDEDEVKHDSADAV